MVIARRICRNKVHIILTTMAGHGSDYRKKNKRHRQHVGALIWVKRKQVRKCGLKVKLPSARYRKNVGD
jgi:hypothetical protein